MDFDDQSIYCEISLHFNKKQRERKKHERTRHRKKDRQTELKSDKERKKEAV